MYIHIFYSNYICIYLYSVQKIYSTLIFIKRTKLFQKSVILISANKK